MGKRASVKYRSLRTNLVHLPLSLYSSLAQQQVRPQGVIIHLSPLASPSSSSKRPQDGYLGWSGLSSATSLAGGLAGIGGGDGSGETVEVDPEVAMDLGWAEGTVVEISIIHHPTRAKSVTVTPLSSDDWEILEEHASFLENNLLGQLRAASQGQQVNVWVQGNTKIRIQIDETNPSIKDSAVLIGHDTEVYVAPRPRKAESASSSHPQVLNGSSNQDTDRKGKAPMAGPSVRLRLIPEEICGAWGRPTQAFESASQTSYPVALCSPATIHRLRTRLKIKERDSLNVSLLAVEHEQDSRKEPKHAAEPSHEESTPESGEDEGIFEVSVLPWDEMPDGHVVIIEPPKPPWSGWGSIKVYANSRRALAPRRKRQVSHNIPLSGSQRPSPLPGFEQTIDQAYAYLRRSFYDPTPRPLLLTGAKGTGKTSIAHHLGRLLATDRDVLTEPIYLDITKLDVDGRLSELRERMTNWLEDATRRRPALLILDGLEHLVYPQNELNSSAAPTALAETFCRLFSSSSLSPGLLILATASNTSALHPLLNDKHVFGKEMKIALPDREIRQQILRCLITDESRDLLKAERPASDDQLDVVALSSLTEGYTPADLSDIVELAMQESIVRGTQEEPPAPLVQADFIAALESFTPASLKGAKLQQSDVQWSDIGGLHDPRRILRETLEWPTKYAQIFASSPLRLRSGLLLYGYPGCGKTLLASAVAKECGLNFISIKGPEVLNKYIGASEKAIRDLFARAQGAKPCVLFFDEFDSVAPKRGHDSTGVTDRVVNQLLTEMDGAQGLEGVYVLAATSRPDLIDPALLRPGRLDKSILCDMPSFADRLDILQTLSRKMTLASTVDLELVAHDTNGYSGADLQAVMYNAHLDVVQSSISLSNGQDHQDAVNDSVGKGKGKARANGEVTLAARIKPRRSWKQVAPSEQVDDPEAVRRLDDLVVSLTTKPIEAEGLPVPDRIPKLAIEQHHLLRSLDQTRPSVSQPDFRRLATIMLMWGLATEPLLDTAMDQWGMGTLDEIQVPERL